MIEMKLFSQITEIPLIEGHSTIQDVNPYRGNLTDLLGDGYEPISHTITPSENGKLLVTILFRREIDLSDIDTVSVENPQK